MFGTPSQLLALLFDELPDTRVEVLLVRDGEPADPLRRRPLERIAVLLLGVHRSADTRSRLLDKPVSFSTCPADLQVAVRVEDLSKTY